LYQYSPDYFRGRTRLLFSTREFEESGDSLRFVAEFCSYLAGGIDHRRPAISIPEDLLGSFESVYLWLADHLRVYPDSVRNHVTEIVDQQKLCARFAKLAVLSEGDFVEYRTERVFARLPMLFRALLPPPSAAEEDSLVTRKELLDIKTSLGRLAQLLTYASSIQVVDYDQPLVDSKEHFDPDLIDRNRLVGLLAILRIQAGEIADVSQRSRIIATVDRLETELKRSKVRWGIVISTAFVLFGFLADLKSISPEAYSAVHKTAETIVNVLHREAQVQEATGGRSPEKQEQQLGSARPKQLPRPSYAPDVEEEE
jgi:hypothetical protein